MIECESIMVDNGLMYMMRRIGPRSEPEEHLSAQEHKKNNDQKKRHSVYDHSVNMKTIEGQYH